MNEGEGARGIVVAHGCMAKGLVDAAGKISGVEDGVLVPLSNEGKSPHALQEELDVFLAEGPAVVFTDLPSGSCALAAHLCYRTHPSQALVTGVNLPILLDFVFNRHLPMDELVPRLVSKGIGSVKSAPEYP